MKTKRLICLIISLCVLFSSFGVTAYANTAKNNGVSISKKAVTLEKGDSYKLKLKKANAKKVKWRSKNKKIATVKNGRVTAKGVGKTIIIAKYKMKTYKCRITVKAAKKLKMKINGERVNVSWQNNNAVKELKKLAKKGKITVSMSRYGGFEQVGKIGKELPSKDKTIKTEPGDIVLYSGGSMVVFFGSNTWEYTRLGRIKGKTSEELKALLDRENVTVTIYIE